MSIILPPGSTSADLQSALDNAASGDTIIISGDMPFTGLVTIPEMKEITVQSNTGDHWTLSQGVTLVRHFDVLGTLILRDLTLDGGDIGGGVHVTIGNFTMAAGTVIQHCFVNSYGGGIFYSGSGTVDINGGRINNNKAGIYGGGVYSSGTCTISNSEIKNNEANFGGGLYQNSGSLTINSSVISGNSANFHGGGIDVIEICAFKMFDTTVSDNTARNNGGGIYVHSNGTVEISGKSYVTNNRASNGDGGGIYTADTSYGNLLTGADTVFGCNRASAAYAPPPDAGALYPDVQFTSTTITDHPLNNFDINHAEGEPITVAYNMTYDANGGTGSHTGPDIMPGGTDTVLSPDKTGIRYPGYTFTGWNTEPDGGGTKYNPGESIILNCPVILYAQWIPAERFTITYGANGGSGSFEDYGRQFGDNYMILSLSQTGISRPGFTFIGWNTKPDGSGTAFAPGDIVMITGDVRLYAQWRQKPAPKPKKMCRKPVIKCRENIAGQIIWDDNDDKDGKRPDNVEILLFRDGVAYKRTLVSSENGWAFGFCCLPVMKNSSLKYDYQIDETDVPGYTKKIEGYNVINTPNLQQD